MEFCDPTRIDETLHELNMHGTKNFPYQYFYSHYGGTEGSYFPGHWHREIEMVRVTAGEVYCLVGQQRIHLRTGEGLVIHSGVIHGYETPTMVEMPTVLFMPELLAPQSALIHTKFIEPLLNTHLSHALLTGDVPWQKSILVDMAQLDHLNTVSPETLEMDIHATLSHLWHTLFVHRNSMETLSKTENATLVQARLRKMLAFIEESFACDIHLIDIARAASISVSEALRCFREGVHTTPIDYLIRYRLNYARSLLLTTSLSITAIAIEVGFSGVAYFDRLFQHRFNMKPTQYRKSHATRLVVN